MKVTFTIQGKTDAFYHGNADQYPPDSIMRVKGLSEYTTHTERFTRLQDLSRENLGVKMRVGTCNAFRDRVELNQLIRSGKEPSYTLEPRRGYNLATFLFE